MYDTQLSVVVTVYNTEKYLEKCIKSILNQKYKEIEIILVDDGSTDNSADICKKYAENLNIFYIYQENQGQIKARLAGAQKAVNEYIAFIDSDDWIDPDYFINLFTEDWKNGQSSDMVTSELQYDGKKQYVMKLPAASCGVSARDSLRSSLVCCAASCGELNPLFD